MGKYDRPRRLGLVWPQQGLNETWEFSKQQVNSCRVGRNVRSRDPLTGRHRGAQRSGLAVVADLAAGGFEQPVRALERVAAALPEVTWNALEDQAVSPPLLAGTWAFEVTPDSGGEVYAVALGPDGTTWWVDGGSLRAQSADGEDMQRFKIPMQDKRGVVRTLAVDEFGQVYAAVTEGGDFEEARIWSWAPFLDETGTVDYRLRWEVTAGGWVTDLVLDGDRMFVTQDNPDIQKSAVVVYRNVLSSAPVVESLWEVPWPTGGLAVNGVGEVLTTHPPAPTRLVHPLSPDTSPVQVATTLQDLEDAGDINIWSWYSAEAIAEEDRSGPASDPRVDKLRDISRKGPGRHFFAAPNVGESPFYMEVGPLAGKPAVLFKPTGSAGTTPSVLATLDSPSQLKEHADQQLSAVPTYEGGQFCVVMVISPVSESAKGPVFAQALESDGSPLGLARPVALILNRDESDSTTSGPVAGLASIRDEGDTTDTWGGTGNNPLSMTFDAKSHSTAGGAPLKPPAAVVTFFCDGALTPSAGQVRSLLRWNGVPVDRATSRPLSGRDRTYLGYDPNNISWSIGHFMLHEMVVLDRIDRTDDTTGCFSDHKTNAAYTWPGPAWASTDSVLEKVEGILARKWGIGHLLDDGATLYSLGDGGIDSTYQHAYGEGAGAAHKGETVWSGSGASNPARALTVNAITAKWNRETLGRADWIIPDFGGMGYGIVLQPGFEANFWTVGPKQTSPLDAVQVRKWQDQTTTVLIVWATNFEATAAAVLENPYCRIAADEDQNLFVPFQQNSDAGTLGGTLFVFKSTGTVLIKYLSDPDPGEYLYGYAVALPSSRPDYSLSPGTGITGKERPEFAVLGMSSTMSGFAINGRPALQRSKLVDTTPTQNPPRRVYHVGVVGGVIKTFDPATGTVSTPAGGVTLSPSSAYISAVTLFGKVYFADGESYAVFDPVKDTVAKWKASRGELPKRMRVLTAYRGRIVGFGSSEGAHNWFMSAKDDPDDWEFSPPVRTPNQAVAGNNPELAGLLPETITCFAPLTDDVAIVGTDSSIFRMVGDPLSANGQIDVISRKYGIAWGRAWTQDPEGVLYVVLSNGEVAAVSPQGEIRRLSRDRIDSKTSDIDWERQLAVLEWNREDDALHVFVVPQGTHGQVNLLPRTAENDMTDPAWTNGGGIVVTPNAATAPDGTMTASLLSDTSTSLPSWNVMDIALPKAARGLVIPCVLFLKPDTTVKSNLTWEVWDTATASFIRRTAAVIDWTAGTVTAVGFNDGEHTATMEAFPNGWFKVTITVTHDGSSRIVRLTINIDGNPTTTLQGWAWGVRIPQPVRQHHLVWEKAVNAWWTDEFAADGLSPISAIVLDGDATDDRLLAIGCEDGKVRAFKTTAYDDDGTAISSEVVWGPFSPEGPETDWEYRYQGHELVLAGNQHGATLGLFGSNHPGELGPFETFPMQPGRNPRIFERALGAFLFVSLRNGRVNERWAMESLACEVVRAGRKRADSVR